MALELRTLASDFATALRMADARLPQAAGRLGRIYQSGIGPHAEDKAVKLIVEELRHLDPHRYATVQTRIPYLASKQACDLGIGTGPEWAIEIKMARPNGDNGKPDDTSIKDILSPYESDRSALSDCVKLGGATFPGRVAVLIYGFEDIHRRRPLHEIIDAFEVLARAGLHRISGSLGERVEVPFDGLVHPVFESGAVFAWEIRTSSKRPTPV